MTGISEPGAVCCTLPGAAPGYVYSLVLLAFFIHVIEAMAGLPAWLSLHGPGLPASVLGNGALGLFLAAALIGLVGRSLPYSRAAQIGVALLCGGFMADAVGMVVASLLTGALMPGLVSAELFLLPASLWLIARLPLPARARLTAALTGAVLAPGLAGLALWAGLGIAA